jgi:hypothetical protein
MSRDRLMRKSENWKGELPRLIDAVTDVYGATEVKETPAFGANAGVPHGSSEARSCKGLPLR